MKTFMFGVLFAAAAMWALRADAPSLDKDAQIEQLKDQVRIWKARADYSDSLLTAVRTDVANCVAALEKQKEAPRPPKQQDDGEHK